jgi:hypothetical protein
VNTFNLEAKRYTSRVLTNWSTTRPGASRRMADVVDAIPVQRISNMQVYSTASSDNDAMAALFQPIASASGFAITD